MQDILAFWYDRWLTARTQKSRETGSVTMENVIWALAVIVIAGIVVAAITAYVTNHSGPLLGP